MVWASCFAVAATGTVFAAPRLTGLSPEGRLTWSGAVYPGICTVETAPSVHGEWQSLANTFSVTSTGSQMVTTGSPVCFFRLREAGIPPTAEGFTNLIRAYGQLETLAGNGAGRVDNTSYWQPHFEGAPGPFVSLSRPHWALADRAGNIYIADKNSHAILRLDTNGTIHTHAGTHVGGFNGEGPAPATTLQLNAPNALWVRADGTVYVLDTDNARVRRVTTNGILSTFFNAKADVSTPLGGGRCLWVKDDETLAYFGNTDRIRKWTPGGGLANHATGFNELGCFYVEPDGNLLVADRGAHRVYRVATNGTRVTLAGNGTTTGGGDGQPALLTGLPGPRGVWPLPTGGFLLLLHDGAQLWYVDAAGIARLLVHGTGGNAFVHAGDGEHFYAPDEPRIGEGRSVALDFAGNILLCESDYGFIRRIRFQRLPH
jgi:sugar lactone lactonase YvrE